MTVLRKMPAFIGALILLLGAGFHLTGLPLARSASTEVTNQFMKDALPALWLMPTYHWVMMALLVLFVTSAVPKHSKLILLLIAATVLCDAVSLFLHVGAFVGAPMLLAAGLLVASSAFLIKRREEPTTT